MTNSTNYEFGDESDANAVDGGRANRSIYVSKKTVAQGMFDVALLSSNTNQLVHLINSRHDSKGTGSSGLHTTAITLLIISIIFQVIVGGCLIIITVMTRPSDPVRKASMRRLNNISTIMIFFITVLNVMIPSFTPNIVYT